MSLWLSIDIGNANAARAISGESYSPPAGKHRYWQNVLIFSPPRASHTHTHNKYAATYCTALVHRAENYTLNLSTRARHWRKEVPRFQAHAFEPYVSVCECSCVCAMQIEKGYLYFLFTSRDIRAGIWARARFVSICVRVVFCAREIYTCPLCTHARIHMVYFYINV